MTLKQLRTLHGKIWGINEDGPFPVWLLEVPHKFLHPDPDDTTCHRASLKDWIDCFRFDCNLADRVVHLSSDQSELHRSDIWLGFDAVYETEEKAKKAWQKWNKLKDAVKKAEKAVEKADERLRKWECKYTY